MSVLKHNPFIESIELLIEAALNISLIYYNLLYIKVCVGNDLLFLSGLLGICCTCYFKLWNPCVEI